MTTAPAGIGEPHVTATAAVVLRRVADDLTSARAALPDDGASWRGPAARAAAAALALHPRDLDAAAAALTRAAAVLARHAEVLDEARRAALAAAAVDVATGGPPGPRVAAAVHPAVVSSQRVARELDALADAAPQPHRGLAGAAGTALTWSAEARLGAAEALPGLLGLVRLANPAAAISNPGAYVTMAASMLSGVRDSVRDPLGTLRNLVDLDLWRHNPARALGRLAPDAVLGAATGGTAAAASRGATITARLSAAATKAATWDAQRRAALALRADIARVHLVADAVDVARRGAHARVGQQRDGERLDPLSASAAAAYLSASAAAEPAITARIADLVRTTEGQLRGLEHRLKEEASLRRKLAAEEPAAGASVAALLASARDVVRYTIVLPPATYTAGVRRATAAIERAGFSYRPLKNAWTDDSRAYRGVNTTWIDPATGTAFEVQFHTPDSYRITKETHDAYELVREPGTSATQKAELERWIAQKYEEAALPPGVADLTRDTLPPGSVPAPIQLPPDLRAPAAVAGAASIAGSTLLVTDHDRQPPTVAPDGGGDRN